MVDKRSKGIIRPFGEEFSKQLKDSEKLDDSGYVLKLVVENSINKLGKAGAGDFSYAVNTKSTRDRLDMTEPPDTFLKGSDSRLDTIDCIDEGEIGLKVVDNNAKIVEGDPLVPKGSATGKVDKYTPTTIGDTTMSDQSSNIVSRFKELAQIVGYAREDIAAGSASAPGENKVHAKLTIKNVPVIA